MGTEIRTEFTLHCLFTPSSIDRAPASCYKAAPFYPFYPSAERMSAAAWGFYVSSTR